MDGQGYKPSRGFTSAYSLVSMTQQLATLAAALGRDDQESWAAEAGSLLAAFNDAWLAGSSNSSYDQGLQSNQVLGLSLMGPTNDERYTAALAALKDALASSNNHLSTGIIGTRHLFEVLLGDASGDGEELALEVLGQVDYPSYGFMAFNSYEPATDNMWELFSAPCEGNGMNSRNHHMFSSVGAAITRLAGLESGRKCGDGGGLQQGNSSSRCRLSVRVAAAKGLSAGRVDHDGVYSLFLSRLTSGAGSFCFANNLA